MIVLVQEPQYERVLGVPGVLDTHTFEWDFDYVDTFTPTGSGAAPSQTYYSDGSFTVAVVPSPGRLANSMVPP